MAGRRSPRSHGTKTTACALILRSSVKAEVLTMAVTGWKLDGADRDRLLERFGAHWPDVIADHITLDVGASRNTPLPDAREAQIVGIADDGEGVEAMVVAIEGSTDRPDGSTFHITWSLDRKRGRKPVESNEVIAREGWRAFDEPVMIRVIPARF